MRVFFISFLSINLLIGCTNTIGIAEPPSVPVEIRNNPEYQELVATYKKEAKGDLKVHALNYLLANIHTKFSLGGDRLRCLNAFFEQVEGEILKHESLPEQRVTTKIWDSVSLDCNEANEVYVVPDIEVVDFDFLSEVVNSSFEKWENEPWAQGIEFKDFLEYLLPYRSGIEPLEGNYDFITDKYTWLKDSLTDMNNPVEAATLVNRDMQSWFRFYYKLNDYPGDIAISNLYKGRQGICSDMANLACVTMRKLGIPVAVDFTPQWGNKKNGHDWNVVFDQEMKAVPFMGAESNPGEESSYFISNIPAKVYRRTYANQLNWPELPQDIPPLYHGGNIIDVTGEYTKTSDVRLNLNSLNSGRAYVNVFSRNGWNPLGYGKVENGQAHFNDLGRGVLYLASIYGNDQNVPVGHPFLIDSTGAINHFVPEKENLQQVKLLRKYPLHPHILEHVDKMIGGRFQGANDPNFTDAVDLHTVSQRPDLFYQEVEVETEKSFKYFRYLSPVGGFADVAEIEVYEHQGKLSGDVINQSKWDIASDAFDENIDTFFATAEAGSGEWIGLAFDEPKHVSKIRFLPRNDNNYVIPGHTHELFYWDETWVSLGKQVPTDYRLVYDGVPANALLWLRNLDYGQEERIFSYENGQQVWY